MTLHAARATFLLFPKDDDRFAERVESMAGDTPVRDSGHLEQELRRFYPQAVVRHRDSLGELSPDSETWYVYRDGSPVPADA